LQIPPNPSAVQQGFCMRAVLSPRPSVGGSLGEGANAATFRHFSENSHPHPSSPPSRGRGKRATAVPYPGTGNHGSLGVLEAIASGFRPHVSIPRLHRQFPCRTALTWPPLEKGTIRIFFPYGQVGDQASFNQSGSPGLPSPLPASHCRYPADRAAGPRTPGPWGENCFVPSLQKPLVIRWW
jgi:hypothetical protein